MGRRGRVFAPATAGIVFSLGSAAPLGATLDQPPASGPRVRTGAGTNPKREKAMTQNNRGSGGAGVREEWRRIPGFKHYEVSNLGRARSLDREIPAARGVGTCLIRGRILKTNGSARPGINTSEDGIQQHVGLARAVAAAFLDLDLNDNSKVARCLDGDPHNCRLDNIAVGTMLDVVGDKDQRGTLFEGVDIHHASLTPQTAVEALEMLDKGHTTGEVARRLGVTVGVIYNLGANNTYKDIEYGNRRAEVAAKIAACAPEVVAEPEEWRKIPGFTLYEVSDLGRVRSLGRMVDNGHGPKWRPGRVLTPGRAPNALFITVCENGKKERITVARAVAAAFLGLSMYDRLQVARRIDGDKWNVRLDNLYVTRPGRSGQPLSAGEEPLGRK